MPFLARKVFMPTLQTHHTRLFLDVVSDGQLSPEMALNLEAPSCIEFNSSGSQVVLQGQP
jgi:hypothetical protein